MKKYLAGFLACMLLCSFTPIALASTGTQNLKASFRNIRVSVNDTIISLTDASGKTVEPFIVNGTTYLPVRAVAQALGQNVSWDGNTNTVIIGGTRSGSASSAATPVNTVIYQDNGIKITYLGKKRTQYVSGDEYSFKIENTNPEKYMVVSEDALIDNVSFSGGLLTAIEGGTIAYDEITVWDDTLTDDYPLSSYQSLSFKIHTYPYDSWNIDDTKTSQRITIRK